MLAIAETATQSLDTEKILNDTLDKSLEILHFDVGLIRVLDASGENILVRVTRGLRSPNVLPVKDIFREPNTLSLVFETKEPYVSPDIRNNPIYKNRTLVREGVISVAHAPVMSKKRVMGTLTVGSRRFHRFAQREINLLKAFGAQLGVALENAQLYEEVSKGKNYIESLVENAGDAILSTDMEDRILSWNRAAELIFGYTKEEIIGEHLSVLLAPERSRVLDDMRAKVQISGTLRDLEVRSKRKDGTMIYLSLSVSPIKNIDGSMVGCLRVAKDITEKKRLERRLKELDKMKSDFVSNVSHELRTPLTAIKGSVDNMLDGITGPLNEKQTRYLTRIKFNADRLARLINDILDLSKIEAGRIDLKPADLAVVSLIQEVTEMLRPVATEKLINLETSFPNPDLTAWADRDKVTQVLVNLIGNAVKFTPSQGTVRVAAEEEKGDWVRISVSDSGPGMAPDEANRVFDKFYQIAQANKQKAKGTGLGLAISKALIDMHGGKIWVETGLGKGSIFSFTLARQRPFVLDVPAL